MRPAKTLPAALLAVMASWCGGASAEPKVIVFGTEAGPAPHGFVQALAIQCAGSAEVQAAGSVAGSVSDKLRAVDRPLRDQNASVGIWVERSSNATVGEFSVYVASRRKDRVLVQVVRLPGRDEPETDRALALKVSEVLDRVLAASGDVTTLVAEPEPAQASSDVVRWQPVAFVGFALASAGNGSTELGATVGAGVRRASPAFVAELTLELRPFLPVDAHAQAGDVRTRELDLLLRGHALSSGGPLAAGLELGVGTGIWSATGTAPDGRTGDATRAVPFVHAGPEVRVALGSAVTLRLEGGLDLALRRQRFSVLGSEVADVGTVRGSGDLSVLVAF
jgi:hypothetical protein